MISRYYDPTYDVAFKVLFKKKERLIHFLNSILNLEEGCRLIDIDYKIDHKFLLSDIDYKAKEMLPNDPKKGRKSIFDIKVTDQAGRVYVIEMQRDITEAFVPRMEYYASHALVDQLVKGSKFDSIMPVIALAVSSKDVFPEGDSCVSFYRMKKECDAIKGRFSNTAFVIVELSRFEDMKEGIPSLSDQWMHLLKYAKHEQQPPQGYDDTILDAYRALEEYSWTLEERDAYLRERLAISYEEENRENDKQKHLKEGFENGKKEGFENGKKEGFENGKKEGFENGKKEGREEGFENGKKEGFENGKKEGREEGFENGKKEGREEGFEECVQKFLMQGLSYQIISCATGMSVNDIEKMDSSMKAAADEGDHNDA